MTSTHEKALEMAAIYLESAGQTRNDERRKELESNYIALLNLIWRVWNTALVQEHENAQRMTYKWDGEIYQLKYYELRPSGLVKAL